MEELLKKEGQEHLLIAYERLDEEGKKALKKQIETIDLEECRRLYALTKKKKEFSDVKLDPILASDASTLADEEIEKITQVGEEEIRKGK